ncbi:myelin proteolipid protein-like isoform X2 [Liolophura sinensis]|uniref:myelin proteolipid protein-like isoform X2 n=1 Tax=Liolophura sinensis TaxID=3198878 RepID=UPI0031586E70
MPTAKKNNACEQCLSCLAHVPCPSLCSWILLLIGLGGITGGVVYGVRKTRDLVVNSDFLWFIEFTLVGACVGMFIFGTFFLILCHYSSDPTSRHVFNSFKKNACARAINMVGLVLVYLFLVAWIVLLSTLVVPIIGYVVLLYLYDSEGRCIDLRNYGLSDHSVCGSELTLFKIEGQEAFISFSVAYFAALLVIISLVNFMICMTSNLMHLKDSRYATLNPYQDDEIHTSKHSILETTM